MKGRTGIIIAAVALGAAVLFLFGARGTAAEAVYPVENGRNWFSRHVGTRVRGVFSRMDLATENRRLKEENAALRMELSSSRLSAPSTKHQLDSRACLEPERVGRRKRHHATGEGISGRR